MKLRKRILKLKIKRSNHKTLWLSRVNYVNTTECQKLGFDKRMRYQMVWHKKKMDKLDKKIRKLENKYETKN